MRQRRGGAAFAADADTMLITVAAAFTFVMIRVDRLRHSLPFDYLPIDAAAYAHINITLPRGVRASALRSSAMVRDTVIYDARGEAAICGDAQPGAYVIIVDLIIDTRRRCAAVRAAERVMQRDVARGDAAAVTGVGSARQAKRKVE